MKKSEKWNFQGKGVLWASTTVDIPALGLGTVKLCGEKGKEGVFLRFEAFEALHADGVALGLYLRAAISVADLQFERHLGGASARGI